MRILITNDDGIHAPQLLALAHWAKRLGEVTVVAPKQEQSGKSQGIELHEPFEVKEIFLEEGISAWTVDSTPADCVRYAVFGMKKTFDLVISGVNRGYNMGADIMYSGTAGAVFEAANLGMKAVALSTCPPYCDRVAAHFDQIFDFVLGHKLLELNPAYNINVPPEATEFRITRQGGPYYSDDFVPIGNDLYQAKGKCVYEDSFDDTLDTDAVNHGYISVMPLTVCRTDLDTYDKLRQMKL